ncbi:MAG: HD domain-containing protein [Deltaproteobacteria bacterium]|nr:HD domain-containing protein [Deltaproteobacteria bacterium]
MRVELNVFNSRLAKRIFATFIACAMIPVIILAVLSLYQVSDQLKAQAHLRLRRAAKNHGLSIYEHLMFCEDELKMMDFRSPVDIELQQERFSAIGRRFPDGRYEAIFGNLIPITRLSPEEQTHLNSGASLLVVTRSDTIAITLVRYVDVGSGSPEILMGTVRGDYLWGIQNGNNLPPLSEFAVVDATGLSLYRSFNWPLRPAALNRLTSENKVRVHLADTDWFVANGSLFLKPKFGADSWSLVVLQPEEHVLAPIARFKLIFVLVVVLALLLVVVLSLFNLRRSLGPLDALKKGAQRIAKRDFDHRVHVSSRDEFQELAESFNTMSGQLGRQFRFMATRAKIDHATLSDKDFTHISGLTIVRLLKDFRFDRVGISRVNVDEPDEALIYAAHRVTPDFITSQPFHISEKHLSRFHQEQPWVVEDDPAEISHYLPADFFSPAGTAIFFPVYIEDKLFALLFVSCRPGEGPGKETFPLVRQIADHLAVAWSNVNLIRDLRRLTIGSLQALAGTVDAKSPWTAGHSARVMQISLSIGRHMGLPPERIDRLERAALLHDIGKIGISSKILDKPGRLTDEEFDIIKSHPVIGNRILTPITAFKEIIPMIRQHHERWDGKGYPDGLSGDVITLEARIMAVADVYDAMTSDRPYRKGMERERVFSIMKSEAGHQFDPAVVEAFLELIQEKSALAA